MALFSFQIFPNHEFIIIFRILYIPSRIRLINEWVIQCMYTMKKTTTKIVKLEFRWRLRFGLSHKEFHFSPIFGDFFLSFDISFEYLENRWKIFRMNTTVCCWFVINSQCLCVRKLFGYIKPAHPLISTTKYWRSILKFPSSHSISDMKSKIPNASLSKLTLLMDTIDRYIYLSIWKI